MSEIRRIKDQLRRAFEGEAWHGPSVKEVLSGVTAEKAALKAVPGAHSIWELVHHIAAWEEIAFRRVNGENTGDAPDEVDWPPVNDTSDEAWGRALAGLDRSNAALREAIAQLDESRLEDLAPGTGYTLYYLLHGVIQHDLYHAGQIALLKKAVG
jgi:uncharacterized damage-inducible protein DinB